MENGILRNPDISPPRPVWPTQTGRDSPKFHQAVALHIGFHLVTHWRCPGLKLGLSMCHVCTLSSAVPLHTG